MSSKLKKAMKKFFVYLLLAVIWLVLATVGFFFYIFLNWILGEAAVFVALCMFFLCCNAGSVWERDHLKKHRKVWIRYASLSSLWLFLLFIADYYVFMRFGVKHWGDAGVFAAMSAYGFGTFGLIHLVDYLQRS